MIFIFALKIFEFVIKTINFYQAENLSLNKNSKPPKQPKNLKLKSKKPKPRNPKNLKPKQFQCKNKDFQCKNKYISKT